MSYDFECGTCGKVFLAGWKARDNHLRSTGHEAPDFECDKCARYFGSERARFQHMEALNHFSWECSICDETWPTDSQRTKHEHDDHNYCRECQRSFTSPNSLKMHLNSRIHNNYRIACPFCNKSHPTATGLTYHIETGSCSNAAGVDRDTLFRLIRSKDPNGIITKNLIGWPGSGQYEATDRAYNYERRGWECYLCSRLFKTIQSLNQHLNSPTHQEDLYHCPNRSCGKEFKTLAACMHHLESESCGYMRFAKVQHKIRDVVAGKGLLTF